MNKVFILTFFILFLILFYIYYFFNLKNIYVSKTILEISKGENLNQITDLILYDEIFFNKKIYLVYLKIINKYIKKIKFGEFEFNENLNLIEITEIISNPSNVYKDLTIIDGWQIYQSKELVNDIFNIQFEIPYYEILADTYKYQSHNTFEEIYDLMKISKKIFFSKNINNELFNNYTIDQVMTAASLVEKEGKDYNDKKLISSVIFNRLEKNIKLQIDATTIFAITKGKFKFNRKLTYDDLNIKDHYNTYSFKGLPPTPICYVSIKTIEIILENYKSEYLFYFFNEKKDKHIFSKSFKEHKQKLKQYRLK